MFLCLLLACCLVLGCAAPQRETNGVETSRPAPPSVPTDQPDAGLGATPIPVPSGDAGLVSHVDREPDELEWEGLMALARRAEVLRQLIFKSVPEVRIQDADAIRAFMAQQLDDAELERKTKRYRALGLIDASVNLREQSEQQAKQDVLGYYSPEHKRLVLREDVAYALRYRLNLRENLEWKSVILHELVHALQDQHFDLRTAHERAGSGDAGEAYSALVEGDATLVMLQYVIRRAGVTFESMMADPVLLEKLVLSNLRRGTSFAGPPALHSQVPFRYVAGAAFVAALWREGGWARVNRAFSSPPRASAEVLNPDRFLLRASSPRLPHSAREQLTQSGYSVLEEETLGAIVFTAFLATSGVNADSAVEAWAGDRFLLVEHDASVGYAWVIACNEHSSAADLRRVLEFVQEAQQKERRFRVRSGQEGPYLLVTGNLPESLHAGLMKQLRRGAPRMVSR